MNNVDIKTPLVEFRDIHKRYGVGAAAFEALKGVNFRIDEGEFVAIMGPSGSGKSTTMNIIGALDRPTAGEYLFDGVHVEGLSRDQLAMLRRYHLGFVFQGFNLLARTTALENVELPLLYRGLPRAERHEKAMEALERVGLADWSRHTPSELSGGQQQRVAIARALVTRPRLLLADEPTGSLDSARSVEIMELLTELNREDGITIALVTHEPDMAKFARRHLLFRDGELISDTVGGLPMIGNAFLLAIRQIARNPMRSLLTVLGVVIGVAAVVTMVTVGNGASSAIREQIESFGNNQLMLRPGMRLGPGQAVGAPDFKLADVRALATQIAGIEGVAPQTSRTVTVVGNGRNWSTSIIGTTNAYFDIDNRTLAEGRYFEDGEIQSGAAVCVIGETIRRELFGENSSVIGASIRTGGFSCRVIGLLAAKGSAAMGGDQDDLLVMPLQTVQRRLLGKPRVGSLLLRMNADSDRERIKEAVRDLMRERRSLSAEDDDNFQLLDTAEIAEKVASTTNIMTTLLAAVAAVSLLVGGIGIMNIMLVSVTERTREIGIRLAIGALEREVLMQFLIESLMLGVLGGVLGLLLAFGASKGLAYVMEVPFLFSPGINLLAFGVSALTGVIFGFFPARRAAKLDPIDAVRHE